MVTTPQPASSANAISVHDYERVLDFVNEIRIAYTTTTSRQPLNFERRERRASARIPLQVPIHLTPVSIEDGYVCFPTKPVPSVKALTKDLSLKGVGFAHEAEFSNRHAALTFDVPTDVPLSLIVEVTWSKQYHNGKFRSGARFLSLIETPADYRSAD